MNFKKLHRMSNIMPLLLLVSCLLEIDSPRAFAVDQLPTPPPPVLVHADMHTMYGAQSIQAALMSDPTGELSKPGFELYLEVGFINLGLETGNMSVVYSTENGANSNCSVMPSGDPDLGYRCFRVAVNLSNDQDFNLRFKLKDVNNGLITYSAITSAFIPSPAPSRPSPPMNLKTTTRTTQ